MAGENFDISSRMLSLTEGMYIFRFATVLAPGHRVWISLQEAAVNSPAGIDFFPGTGVRGNTLSRLGDCIVVRVNQETRHLLINQYSPAGQASAVVDLRVDRIDTSEAIVRMRPAAEPPALAPAALATTVRGKGRTRATGARTATSSSRPTLRSAA